MLSTSTMETSIPKRQFSILRLLLAITVFAMVLALFRHAEVLNTHAFATRRGPVVISFPALILQWVASSITVGGVALIPYGRKGFVLGSLVGGVCISLLLIAFFVIRAGSSL